MHRKLMVHYFVGEKGKKSYFQLIEVTGVTFFFLIFKSPIKTVDLKITHLFIPFFFFFTLSAA